MEAEIFEQLFERMRHGDSTALEEFYNAYASRISKIAYMFLKDFHLAEDVVHDVTIRVWKKARGVHNIENPNGWVYRVVKNFCLNLKKKKKPHTLIENAYISLDVSRHVEANVLFYQALTPLKENEQKILILKLIADYTFKEIAKELKIKQNTVSKIYYRSLEKIEL